MVKSFGSQRGLSRIEAIMGAIVLVVVVVSLFMLKGKFEPDTSDADAIDESSADTTPRTPDSPTSSPPTGQHFSSPRSNRLLASAEQPLPPP